MRQYEELGRDELIRLLRESDSARQATAAHDETPCEYDARRNLVADLDAITLTLTETDPPVLAKTDPPKFDGFVIG